HLCTLSLHDALPISSPRWVLNILGTAGRAVRGLDGMRSMPGPWFGRRGPPLKLVGIAPLQAGDEDDLLRVTAEVREAIPDGGQQDRKSTRLNSSHVS